MKAEVIGMICFGSDFFPMKTVKKKTFVENTLLIQGKPAQTVCPRCLALSLSKIAVILWRLPPGMISLVAKPQDVRLLRKGLRILHDLARHGSCSFSAPRTFCLAVAWTAEWLWVIQIASTDRSRIHWGGWVPQPGQVQDAGGWGREGTEANLPRSR